MARKRKCKTRRGPRGGKYHMVRKKGGGTRKRYLSEKGGTRTTVLILIAVILAILFLVYYLVLPSIEDQSCGDKDSENYIWIRVDDSVSPNVYRMQFYNQNSGQIVEIGYLSKAGLRINLEQYHDIGAVNDTQLRCAKKQLDKLPDI